MSLTIAPNVPSKLQLASQHVVAGAAVLVLPELSSSHVPQGAIVCGSPNMKVDRISTLYNSYLYTRYLRGLHIENVIHSRKTPSSLRAPPDCRGESVCVGIARKKG